MDKTLKSLLATILATLIAAAILGGVSMYAQLARLEERVSAQEKRVDYFHGQPTQGERR
jgi:hypothetical protein